MISPGQGLECTFALTECRITGENVFKRNMREEDVDVLQGERRNVMFGLMLWSDKMALLALKAPHLSIF